LCPYKVDRQSHFGIYKHRCDNWNHIAECLILFGFLQDQYQDDTSGALFMAQKYCGSRQNFPYSVCICTLYLSFDLFIYSPVSFESLYQFQGG